MAQALIIGGGSDYPDYHTREALRVPHGDLAFLTRQGNRETALRNTIGVQEGDDGSVAVYLAHGTSPQLALSAVQIALEAHRNELLGVSNPRLMNQRVAAKIHAAEDGEDFQFLRVAAMIIDPQGSIHTHRVGDIEQGRFRNQVFLPFAVPAEAPEITEYAHVLAALEIIDPQSSLPTALLHMHAQRMIPSQVPMKADRINQIKVGTINQMTRHKGQWKPELGEAHLMGTYQTGLAGNHHKGSRASFQTLFDRASTAAHAIGMLQELYAQANTSANRAIVVYKRTS
jgi:hypothetical protein